MGHTPAGQPIRHAGPVFCSNSRMSFIAECSMRSCGIPDRSEPSQVIQIQGRATLRQPESPSAASTQSKGRHFSRLVMAMDQPVVAVDWPQGLFQSRLKWSSRRTLRAAPGSRLANLIPPVRSPMGPDAKGCPGQPLIPLRSWKRRSLWPSSRPVLRGLAQGSIPYPICYADEFPAR